jgi:hypothetical protein
MGRLAAIPKHRLYQVFRVNERTRRHINDGMVGEYLERPATIACRSGGSGHFYTTPILRGFALTTWIARPKGLGLPFSRWP